jgi:pantothenate kinase type III
VVVIDAGTATTISAWRCDPALVPPAGVRFLGGLILPGARTAIAGLTALAPALPSVAPAGPDARALQFSTVGAIGAAMGIGYGPMVAACLIKLERETGIRQVLATGGDCALLVQSEVIPASAFADQLVIEGVALLSG